MKRSILTLLVITLGLYSCNLGTNSKIAGYVKSITKAEQVQVSDKDHTLFITATYPTSYSKKIENIASVMAITAYDTAKILLKNSIPTHITSIVKVGQTSDTFRYKWEEMEIFKNYIYASNEFIKQILASSLQPTFELLDTTVFNTENVPQVNELGKEINQKIPNSKINFDGISLHLDSPLVIQVNANIENKSESLPVSIQYYLKKGKIFYFGVNDNS